MLGEVATGEVVAVSPDDLVIEALRRLLEEQIEHLPVIGGDRLLGICTRTDILKARRVQFAHEEAQPGWRPARLRGTRHADPGRVGRAGRGQNGLEA